MLRIALVLLFTLFAGCSEPPEFKTEDLGSGEVFRHDMGRTGFGFRKRTCKYAFKVSGLTLSYEDEEGVTAGEAFTKCLSLRNGDSLSAIKVTHVKGHYDGPKVRYYLVTDSGIKISVH